MNPRIFPLTIPLALLLACGAVEKTHGARTDAGTPADAATGPSCLGSGALPAVAPSGKTCPPNSDAKKCVEEGWSCVSTWWPQWPEMATVRGEPFQYGSGDSTPSASPIVPVYLDAFQMDTYEVSNADFAAAVGAKILAPPAECDLQIPGAWDATSGEPRPDPVRVRSGWRDGKMDDGKPERPVSCITRASAEAYCESKGGRLPTAFEFAKATRALAPDVRPFPAHPFTEKPIPYNPIEYGFGARFPTQNPGFQLEPFKAVTDTAGAEGQTVDDRSSWGIANLLGNASEHLCTCAEERTGFVGPLVRPAATCKARCEAGIATGGANVSSAAQYSGAAIGAIPPPTNNLEVEAIVNPVGLGDFSWRYLSGDPTFNEHHDPRIGFRCVYPVK